MRQQTLTVASGFERYAKQTRRAEFLAEMEQVAPWAELVALIEPHYPKPGNGRAPVGLKRMLRIYFLQEPKPNILLGLPHFGEKLRPPLPRSAASSRPPHAASLPPTSRVRRANQSVLRSEGLRSNCQRPLLCSA